MDAMDRTSRSVAGRRRGAALVAISAALLLGVVVLVQRGDDSSGADGAATPSRTTPGTPDPASPASPSSDRPGRPDAPSPPTPSPRADPPEADPDPEPPRRVRIPERASGRFTAAPGSEPQVGRGTAIRYTVAVERGLPYTPAEVAIVVDATLGDPRGWTKDGHAFQRVRQRPDIRVLLTSPDTTDRLCAPLQTLGRVSCRNGALVVLNAKRWAYAIPDYDGDVRRYRQYVVNHEVGHALGVGHVECPGKGRLAPLMQQQSYGLDGCRPNAWPR